MRQGSVGVTLEIVWSDRGNLEVVRVTQESRKTSQGRVGGHLGINEGEAGGSGVTWDHGAQS